MTFTFPDLTVTPARRKRHGYWFWRATAADGITAVFPDDQPPDPERLYLIARRILDFKREDGKVEMKP